MNNIVKLTLSVLLLLGVAAAGYWFGTHATPVAKDMASTAKAERKVLYYRNPMGLPDTSPVPKKDTMGMDYVPVFEGDAESGNQLSISIDKVQKLGVKSEAAVLRELNKTLRVTGRIEIDERRTYTIAPKFEGWVERLYVNTTGQSVTRGQPLFDVYSPDLVSTQREYALAIQGLASLQQADDEAKQSMQQLATASATRLKNWDIAVAQSGVSVSNEARPRVTFRAPASGIVLEKKAVQGMRFMPGEMLYQIADLSTVWVIAEVAEQDIGRVQLGSRAQVTADAYPDRTFDGKVAFIYPTLNSATRTVQVRMEIANPKGLLKPAMFASTQIEAGKASKVLSVPTSAVIDSGTRQVVLVRLAEGRFEPRAVTLGSRSDNYVEVLTGITEGEQVVTSANFLLDSESNLKAALSGMSERAAQSAAPASPEQQKQKSVGHQAQGTLESINKDGTVSITHEPIKSLGWPGMTMNFALTNPSLVAGLKPGNKITFELVERKPDEWVITKLQAQQQHEGH
jgi:Cu(I)/Ag(I) efflux system membrane fusion protein